MNEDRSGCYRQAAGTFRRYARATTFPSAHGTSREVASMPTSRISISEEYKGFTTLLSSGGKSAPKEYPWTTRMIERYTIHLYQRLKGLTVQQRIRFLQTALTFKTPTVRHLTAKE